jgi:hypothetical protein
LDAAIGSTTAPKERIVLENISQESCSDLLMKESIFRAPIAVHLRILRPWNFWFDADVDRQCSFEASQDGDRPPFFREGRRRRQLRFAEIVAGPVNSSNRVYSIEFGFTSGAIVDAPCADHSHSRCPLPAPATYDARCRTAPGVSCQILFKAGIRLPTAAIDKLVDEQDRSQSRETNDVAAILIEELYQG